MAAAPMTVFGFDVGARRIGVAVGNTITQSGSELGVMMVGESGPDWQSLERWLKQWQPQMLVVGDPVTLDGSDQPIRQFARGFARNLQARYALPVEQVDERSSSIEAAQRFAQGRATGTRKRHQAAQLDALAAVVILERWLRDHSSLPTTSMP